MKMSYKTCCLAEINKLIATGVVQLAAPSSLLMRGDVVAPLLGVSYELRCMAGALIPKGGCA